MPTESEFRDQLRRATSAPLPPIDADAVVRQAKSRRAPRRVAFGAMTVLAVAGVTTLGVFTLPSLLPGGVGASDTSAPAYQSQVSDSGKDAPGGYAEGSVEPPSAESRSSAKCGEAPLVVPPNSWGLVVTGSFPASAPADGSPVSGTVTLTNQGTTRVVGVTPSQVVIALAHDGTTVWHSNGAVDARGRRVDLRPGESLSYPAQFTPVECTAADDRGSEFPHDLPALAPGDYTVSATIEFLPDAESSGGTIVSGPASMITLR